MSNRENRKEPVVGTSHVHDDQKSHYDGFPIWKREIMNTFTREKGLIVTRDVSNWSNVLCNWYTKAPEKPEAFVPIS